jgi:hypothetical protein
MSKHLMILVSVLGLAACSSSQKKETTTTATTKKEASKKSEAKKETQPAKKAEASAPAGAVQCTSGSDTRILDLKSTDSGGCELLYTKMGNTSTIASQGNGSDKCNEVKERVKGNLVAAGFTCS